MPVEFLCPQCRHRLSISHRKAGSSVLCPSCGHPNRVPGEQPDAAAAAFAALSGADARPPVFDDVPALVADRGDAPTVASTPAAVGPAIGDPSETSSAPWSAPVIRSTPPNLGRPGASHSTRQAPNMADALLLITRRAVYAQAALLLLVVVLAFVAGYLVGRSGEAGPQKSAPAAAPAGGDAPAPGEAVEL